MCGINGSHYPELLPGHSQNGLGEIRIYIGVVAAIFGRMLMIHGDAHLGVHKPNLN